MKIPAFILSALLLSTSAHAAPVWMQDFSTDYSFKTAGTNDLWDPGTYTFDSSAVNNHALWETGGDATGDGVFMLVNGRTDASNSLVWGKTLDLTAPFTLFAKNLCCVNTAPPSYTGGPRLGPSLEFWLDGTKAGDIVTDGPGVWDSYTFASALGAHRYEIRNGSTVFDGNDFGLDFDTAAPVPEPVSIVLFGTGLLAIARGVGRRNHGR